MAQPLYTYTFNLGNSSNPPAPPISETEQVCHATTPKFLSIDTFHYF